MIKFTINEKAIPKKRPRLARQGYAYTPKETRDFEQLVAHHAYQYMVEHNLSILEGAVEACLKVGRKVPASWKGKKREDALDGRIYPICKPDIDNLEKSVWDGLNGVAWLDDSQIVKTRCEKIYSEKDFIRVEIRELTSSY